MPDAFIDLAGTRLRYRIDGTADAPALVLSNSLGTDLDMWDAQVAELARYFRVVRYDTRGHGASTVTPGPYTVEQLGRDVLGLLDGVGIERAHFCGLSLGGMTGLWLGVHAGYRIDRLVLASTAARIGTPEAYETRIAKVRASGMASVAPAVLERWFTPAFIAQHPGAIAPIRAMLERTAVEGYAAGCAAVRDVDLRQAIAAIDRRTLVIAGTHDLATPPADGRFMVERIGGARYVELPAAHLSNIEAAAPFNAALLDFLI